MSQPQPNQDWPAWITAVVAVMTIIGVPLGLLWRRIFASVTRKQFKDYLESRDTLSENRHNANLARFDRLIDDVQDARERLSRMEGEMTGNYGRRT